MVSIMVAAGIGIIITIAITMAVNTALRGMKTVYIKQDYLDLRTDLSNALSFQSTCQTAFQGVRVRRNLNSLQDITRLLGDQNTIENSAMIGYSLGLIKVSSAKIEFKENFAPRDPDVFRARVYFGAINNNNVEIQPAIRPRMISVFFKLNNANLIVDCSTQLSDIMEEQDGSPVGFHFFASNIEWPQHIQCGSDVFTIKGKKNNGKIIYKSGIKLAKYDRNGSKAGGNNCGNSSMQELIENGRAFY